MDDKYSVNLTGQIVAGRDVEEVKVRLAALFKSTPEGIEQLLSKAPVQIKSGVDRDTAMKYKVAVEKAGALCETQALEAEQVSEPPPAAAPAEASDDADAELEVAREEVDATPAQHDVYAPPSASLEDVLSAEEELIEPQKVGAGRAWSWMVAGFRSFTSAPVAWLLIALLWVVITFALGVIPFIGPLALYVIMPILTGGIMIGCAVQHRGEDLEVRHLFAGFGEHGKKLAMLGGVILGSAMLLGVVSMVVVLLVAVALGGGIEMLASGFEGGASGMGPAAAAPVIIVFSLLFLVIFTAFMALFMALWFAPVLVVMHDLDVMESVRLSFRGCLRNWVAFLIVNPLIWMLLTIPVILTLGLGYFVLVPVVMASVYFSYRDIYTA